MQSDDDFAAWFRLLETPGVSRDVARRLLAACGSPAAVFDAPAAALRDRASAAVVQALSDLPPQYGERLKAARAWLGGGSERRVLTLGSADWPPLLLQTADPPLLLYVQGRLAALSAPGIAIVGSRRPTPQGADHARAFAAALGRCGYTIVSGLAQGIDGAAHEGALDAGAATVAVVGTGLDRVYPPRHRDLAARIAETGALVSEFAPGMPPLAENFPQRNRIIAGLTLGTLVVEAALRSGSLITARLANEAGREVFAIPGSILSAQSQGCHALIKQGAKLVETADDIVEELRAPGVTAAVEAASDVDADADTGMETPPAPAAPADPRLAPLLHALGLEPVALDALMARTGWPVPDLSAALLELELEGRVSRLPGGRFQRRAMG